MQLLYSSLYSAQLLLCSPSRTVISLFSLNCYLLPGLFVNENNSTCVNQDIRATKIGQLAVLHDILTFQEVWGSNTDKIQASIAASHTILPECTSTSLFGIGASFFDTAKFYWNQNGGLYSAFRNVRQV